MSMDRDNLYYLDTVTFLVENRLFKVYQYHFMESEVFSTTFSLPSGNLEAEGAGDTNPFILHGIKAGDFQALLKAISPLSSTTLSDMTRDEWLSALKLSTMWGFADTRKQSIQKLSKLELSPINKIVLGREHRVLAWLKEGYDALIKREEVITAEELVEYATAVGWDTMARVLRLRDFGGTSKRNLRCTLSDCKGHDKCAIGHYCSCCHCNVNVTTRIPNIDEEIQEEFLDEFKELEMAAST